LTDYACRHQALTLQHSTSIVYSIFPNSPLPLLPPQPPRTVYSPSVMHAPPSAWPQHRTLLEAPVLNLTHSDPHTLSNSQLSLSLSDARTHKTTEHTTTTRTHARTHADDVSSSTRHARTLRQRPPARTHARTQTTRRRRLAPLPRPLVVSALSV
jgi:hypothetical protein